MRRSGHASPVTSNLPEETSGVRTVLDASSALGRNVVNGLLELGARVRCVHFSSPSELQNTDGLETRSAVPTDAQSIHEALKGSEVVYDCYEPPFAKWRSLLREVTASVVTSSIDMGFSLVVTSPLLNSIRENEPMERDVLNAHRSNLTKTCVARIPQLYGPHVRNALWDQVFECASTGKKAHWLGDPTVPRSLLYVGDAGSRLVAMGEGRGAFGETWNLTGPGPITGKEFIGLAFAAAGKAPRMAHWGRGIMLTGRFLSSDAKSYLKLPYDYYSPFVMDGDESAGGIPSAGYTPHAAAIGETLRWYASLAEPSPE